MEQASQTKGPDGPLTDQLIKFGKFFSRWDETDDGRAVSVKVVAKAIPSTATAGAMIKKFAQPTV